MHGEHALHCQTMRQLKKFILPVLLITALLVGEHADASMYCGRDLVKRGDPIYLVGRKCPEPFWVERWQDMVYNRFGQPIGPTAQTVEIWYFNFGQRRLMRALTFRNGRLSSINTLDYGVPFEPGTRRCTARELERAGGSAGEIYARCGEPDYRYDFSTIGPYYGGPWPPPQGAHREIWAYDMGPGRFIRELYFVDGRLIHTRTDSRH